MARPTISDGGSSPRLRRADDNTRRREIIEAAASLFGSRGYHGTTIRQLADATGILSGSLYAHIKSKEDLLYEIAVLDAEMFLEALRPIAESDEPPEERLRNGLRVHLELVAQYGQQARVFLLEVKELETPERREHVTNLRDEYEALWTKIIVDGQNAGVFGAADVALTRIAIMSLANWAYVWLDAGGRLSPVQVADAFSDFALHGLLRPA